jgi:hypothetical protein
MLGRRLVDEGRAILARLEPEYEYDLGVDRHNELLPLSQDGEHANGRVLRRSMCLQARPEDTVRNRDNRFPQLVIRAS